MQESKQIYIIAEVINSIQTMIEVGQPVWSAGHIKFDYPNEVLNCISGYISSVTLDGRNKVINSLPLHTMRWKYGPFGEELSTYFTSATTEGKVAGFSLMVHMQHWLGERKPAGRSILSKYLFRVTASL